MSTASAAADVPPSGDKATVRRRRKVRCLAAEEDAAPQPPPFLGSMWGGFPQAPLRDTKSLLCQPAKARVIKTTFATLMGSSSLMASLSPDFPERVGVKSKERANT